jgi:hypothetical protein
MDPYPWSEPTTSAPKKPLGRLKIYSIILLAGIAGGMMSLRFHLDPYLISYVVGVAISATLLSTLVVIWIRGKAAAITGSTIAFLLCAMYGSPPGSLKSARSNRSAERALDEIEQANAAATKAAQDSLAKGGAGNLDSTESFAAMERARKTFAETNPSLNKLLDAVLPMIRDVSESTNKIQKFNQEVMTAEFLSPKQIYSIADIDGRLAKFASYRQLAVNHKRLVDNFETDARARLTGAGVNKPDTDAFTKSFLPGLQLDLARLSAEGNVVLCDAHIARFQILKNEFGHWKVSNDSPLFENKKSIQDWNSLRDKILRISAEQVEYNRRYLAARAASEAKK